MHPSGVNAIEHVEKGGYWRQPLFGAFEVAIQYARVLPEGI